MNAMVINAKGLNTARDESLQVHFLSTSLGCKLETRQNPSANSTNGAEAATPSGKYFLLFLSAMNL